MNYRQILFLSVVLSFACLFVPFVWMEVGPLGHQFYGPTVPDVYIYGGDITGKDMDGSGIRAAWILQLIIALIFIVTAIIACFMKKKSAVILFLLIQLLLLVLFPIWLEFYTQMVNNNSDGADLTIHRQYGMIIYWILVGLNITGLILTFRSKKLV